VAGTTPHYPAITTLVVDTDNEKSITSQARSKEIHINRVVGGFASPTSGSPSHAPLLKGEAVSDTTRLGKRFLEGEAGEASTSTVVPTCRASTPAKSIEKKKAAD